MIALDAFALRAVVAAALALAVGGVFVAWTATNAAKRVASFAVALLGAVIAGAALGAPSVLLAAAVVIGFGYLVVGGAVVVRLQEEYASIETPEIDAADARDDASGHKA